MARSLVSRGRNAARRWRLRFLYERIRPELATADVVSRVDAAQTFDSAGRPFSALLRAHLDRMPTAVWDAAPPMPAAAIERARRGEWELLGRTLSFAGEIDWHRDPIFGARWSPRHVDSMSYYRDGGDVVTLWHLNKMMFLLDVAAAYNTTKDPVFAARVYELIDSWCIANPYLVGMNWVSPLDIATRLAVWSQALAAVVDAPPPSEACAGRILRATLRQADHVAAHLSEWPIPNNHLLGEVALLHTFATYWPSWRDAAKWSSRAESILIAESERQILPDGFQFEASVNYHAYALDFFLMYLHAKVLRGETPAPALVSRVHAMAIAHLELVMPSGRRPRIGDDTIDRCFVLAHALDAPALTNDVNDVRASLRPAYENLLVTTKWGRELLDIRVPVRHARHFADAGITIARDHGAAAVFVHGPQHRQLYSHGHLHADAGSFELELDGGPVIVDAGTYVYFADPTARAYFKGARAHNAPLVDDVEPMRSLEPFRWENVACGEALGFGTARGAFATGTRRRLQGSDGTPFDHTRGFVMSDGIVLVIDAIHARQDSMVVPHTHLARLCYRTPTPHGTSGVDGVRVRISDSRRFARIVEAFSNRPVHVETIDDPADRACWYSYRYGELRSGVAVRVNAEFERSVVVVTAIRGPDVSIVPRRMEDSEVLVAIESHAGRRLVQVRFDPFSAVVGGRVLAGRGANPHQPSTRVGTSSTPEWLDELSLDS